MSDLLVALGKVRAFLAPCLKAPVPFVGPGPVPVLRPVNRMHHRPNGRRDLSSSVGQGSRKDVGIIGNHRRLLLKHFTNVNEWLKRRLRLTGL